MKLFSVQRASPIRLQIARPVCAGRRRVRALRCAVGQQSFPDAFNERAREAQEKLKHWAEEQQLQEKLQGAARDAATKAQQAAERVQDSASRTAAQLDREYEVSKKAQQAAERVREAAGEVDVKYGLRRRASQAWADVKRKWPMWRRRTGEFFNTPLGTFAAILLISYATYSGLVFQLFKWFSFFLFVGPLLAAPYIRKKAMEQEQQRQAAYQAYQQQQAQQQQRAQQSQFVNDLFGRFQGRRPRQQQQAQQAQAPRGGPSGGRGWESGPVIDVEAHTIDD
ncbi:hypothetical protein N2152v2_006021 [Parachlorella kessleri]